MALEPAGKKGLQHFHVLSIEGMPKTGKTELTLTAPKKMAILSTDNGWNGLIQKHPNWEENFLVENYFPVVDLSADLLFREAQGEIGDEKAALRDKSDAAADKQAAKFKKELWDPFKADFNGAMANPEVRSVVLDQADEFKGYLRIVNFGKIEQNPQLRSGPVNVEYKSLIQAAHKHKKNLVLIHQMKQKYQKVVDVSGVAKSEAVEGQFTSAANNLGTDYLVHSFVRTHYIPPKRVPNKPDQDVPQKFLVEIIKARLNMSLNGQVLEIPDWQTLMAFLAPDVPGEAWE